MFTETELRDALLHSADRADSLGGADRPDRGGTLEKSIEFQPATRDSVGAESRRTWRRRSVVLPAVAASLVLVLAVGAVTLRQNRRSSATAGSGPSAGATTSAASTVTVQPDVRPGAFRHTSADVGDVVDAVHTSGGPAFEYDLARSGAEVVTRDLGPRTFVQVTVIRPESGFDPDRIPRDHPVRIAGKSGYYGRVRIDPLDGSASDKYSPAWIVAFPSSGGTWIVAELDHAPGPNATYESVPDPSRIVSAYDKLHLNYTSGTARLPFRVVYLPSGMAVDGLTVSTQTDGTQVQADLVKDDKRSISISAAPAGRKDVIGLQCIPSPGPCPVTVSRTVGDLKVSVTGTGYGTKVVRRVLDSLTVAPSATDQADWWTVAQALG